MRSTAAAGFGPDAATGSAVISPYWPPLSPKRPGMIPAVGVGRVVPLNRTVAGLVAGSEVGPRTTRVEADGALVPVFKTRVNEPLNVTAAVWPAPGTTWMAAPALAGSVRPPSVSAEAVVLPPTMVSVPPARVTPTFARRLPRL